MPYRHFSSGPRDSLSGRSYERELRGVTVTVALFLALSVMGASTAVAASKNWGPYSSVYNNHTVVSASGTATHSSGVGYNNGVLVDSYYSDGNAVYAKTSFYDYATGLTRVYSTPEIEQTSLSYRHPSSGGWVMASPKISVIACAQMGWPVPDSCAGWYKVYP